MWPIPGNQSGSPTALALSSGSLSAHGGNCSGTVVAFATTFGWIVDLDLEGQRLRLTVPILAKLAKRFNVLRYRALRHVLQEQLEALHQQRPTGYVSGMSRQRRLGVLPGLIAACDQRDDYVSLRGLVWLAYPAREGALEAVLELTRDSEIVKRLKNVYWDR